MKIRFWGTRGSIPAPLTATQVREKILQALIEARGQPLPADDAALAAWLDEKLPFRVRSTCGGNTACVQIGSAHRDYVLFDAGTGLREFGHFYQQLHTHGSHPSFPVDTTFHLFLSHLHWDHLQGLPFFIPFYFAGHQIKIYSGHEAAEAAVRQQFSTPSFPVPYDCLKAAITYHPFVAGQTLDVAGLRIRIAAQHHPGGSFGFRCENDGRIFVYSSDSEHKQPAALAPDYPFLDFFSNADLLVFDAMYSLADATYSKADWGHSSNVMAVELAARARVKRLALFHHDPAQSDAALEEILVNTRMYAELFHQEEGRKLNGAHKFPVEVLLAYDGLVVEL